VTGDFDDVVCIDAGKGNRSFPPKIKDVREAGADYVISDIAKLLEIID